MIAPRMCQTKRIWRIWRLHCWWLWESTLIQKSVTTVDSCSMKRAKGHSEKENNDVVRVPQVLFNF